MDHYKELNKELVEQVQAMRISLQEHRDEIISLRTKCMNKHENNVHLRKKCKDLAVSHCRQYLELLEPDSSILSYLQGSQQHEGPSTPVQSVRINVENASMRQSARLTVECRRSCSLTQTRRSFNSPSPIRSPSCTEVVEVEGEELASENELVPAIMSNTIAEEDEEYEDDDDAVDLDTIEASVDTIDTNTLCENVAYEGESEGNDINVDAVGHRTRTFRDITNTSHKTTAQETSKNNKRSKGGVTTIRKKDKNSNSTGHENEDPNIIRLTNSPLNVRKLKHVNVSSNICQSKNKSNTQCRSVDNERLVDLTDSDHSLLLDSNSEISQQESIQESRQMPKGTQKSGKRTYPTDKRVAASRRHATTICKKATKSITVDHETDDQNTANLTESSASVKKKQYVTVSRGRCQSKKQSDKQCRKEDNERQERFADSDNSLLQDSDSEVSQQESIQEGRQMSREKQKSGKSLYTPGEEVNVSSYTLTDITLSQFKEATSSTPRQQPDNTNPPRPKRSCKPKSLVEPSLHTKLRNDSGERSLGSRIKKLS